MFFFYKIDLNQIQPNLYRKRGSIISIESSLYNKTIDKNNTNLLLSNIYFVDKLRTTKMNYFGRVKLQLNYDYDKSDFIIKLIKG